MTKTRRYGVLSLILFIASLTQAVTAAWVLFSDGPGAKLALHVISCLGLFLAAEMYARKGTR